MLIQSQPHKHTIRTCANVLWEKEPTLFRGSIFNNVARGLVGTIYEHKPYEEKLSLVKMACELANAKDFISVLPEVNCVTIFSVDGQGDWSGSLDLQYMDWWARYAPIWGPEAENSYSVGVVLPPKDQDAWST